MIELELNTDSFFLNSTLIYTYVHNNTVYELYRQDNKSLFWLYKMDRSKSSSLSQSYNKKFGWLRTISYNARETFWEQVSIEEAKLIIELDIL